jgi:hypothetical protein
MPRKATERCTVLTAEQAHHEALVQAQVLVVRVCGLLAERAANLHTLKTDWGHVGLMTEANRRLGAVARLLADDAK